jgi:hypothetical protein
MVKSEPGTGDSYKIKDVSCAWLFDTERESIK